MHKTHKIRFRAISGTPRSVRRGELPAQTCSGLREEEPGILRTAGLPRCIATLPKGCRLAAVDRRNEVENFLITKGRELILLGYRTPGQKYFITGVNQKIADLKGEIVSCSASGDFLVAATENGIEYFRYDGSYRKLDPEGCIPEISIGITEESRETVRLNALTFKGSYPRWQSPLYEDDEAQISAQLHHAYRTACSSAERRGKFVQPVIVKYAVRMSDDSIIYTSAPVVAGFGIAGCEPLIRKAVSSGKNYTGIEEAVYELPTYVLGLSAVEGTAAEWDGLIKSVDILYRECDEPVLPDEIEYRCSSTSGGSASPNLTEYLKSKSGEAVALPLANTSQWRLLTRITDLEGLRKGEINAPGAAKNGSRNGRIPGVQLYALYNRGIYKNAAFIGDFAPVTAVSAEIKVRGTDSFTGALHLYDGTTVPRINYNPLLSASGEKAAGHVNIRLEITVPDGGKDKTIVSRFGSEYHCSTLSPMISVPVPNAKRLRMVMEKTNGEVLKLECPLMPSEDGTHSFSISPDFKDLSFSIGNTGDFAGITEGNYAEKTGDGILVSVRNNPFVFSRIIRIGDGCPKRLAQADKPVTGNIFGRFPLYAFTDKGIYAVSGEQKNILPRKITSLVPDCSTAPAHTPEGIVFKAGDALYRLHGPEATLICGNFHEGQLIYNAVQREIWGMTQENGTTVIRRNGHRFHLPQNGAYLRDGYAVSEYGEVLDIADGTERILQIGYLSEPYETDGEIHSVTWNIFGEDLKLSLAIYGECGESCHGELITEIHIDGDLNVPLKVPVLPKDYRVVRFEIKGTAGTGTAVYPAILR